MCLAVSAQTGTTTDARNYVNSNITTNGANAITGVKMNTALNKIINAIDTINMPTFTNDLDSLGNLKDVQLSYPSNGQVLAYDTIVGKWVNITKQDVGYISAGNNTTITGSGTQINPYIINATSPNPTPLNATPTYKYASLFIFTGESNAGGYAPNSYATAQELTATSAVNILNNNTYKFEPLHIGFNNNIGHLGLDNTTHGFELELSNLTKAGKFVDSVIYLVKTGQGGSTIDQWDSTNASGYWQLLTRRIDSALAILKRNYIIPNIYIIYSQGFNDIPISHSDVLIWKAKTKLHLQKITDRYGIAPIFITLLKNNTHSYPTNLHTGIIDSAIYMLSENKLIVPIRTNTAGIGTAHWSYDGYKQIFDVIADTIIKRFGLLSDYPNRLLKISGESINPYTYTASQSFMPYTDACNIIDSSGYYISRNIGDPFLTSNGLIGLHKFDAERYFEINIKYDNISEQQSIINILDDDYIPNYGFSDTYPFIAGCYVYSGNIYRSTKQSNTTLMSTISNNDIIKICKGYGRDIIYKKSIDSGYTWTTLYTDVGRLNNIKYLYYKLIQISDGKKIKVTYKQ